MPKLKYSSPQCAIKMNGTDNIIELGEKLKVPVEMIKVLSITKILTICIDL